MAHRDGGGAEQQGDGQPENIQELQDQSGGSAMSGRQPDRRNDGGGHQGRAHGGPSDAPSTESTALDHPRPDDRAPRSAGRGDAD
jgi:hypothetical protein